MKASNVLAVPWVDKSTNVRFMQTFDWRRASFQLLSWLTPTAAARSAEKLFLTPPAPRALTPRARALYARADDRFEVKLETNLGGHAETTRVAVALWGRGPAVYLLHGWGGRGAQWVSFIEPLVRAGFTAVALDAPGHGDTRAPRTSILHFAAALSEVVEGLGPAQAVVGHSLGGAAAALALKRGLEAKSAVLVGAPSDPAAFFETFLGRLGVPDRLHGPIRAHVEREYGFEWDDLAVAAPPNQSVPALVVHDAADAEVAASDADRIVAAWPGSELVTTRGLGHQRILRDGDVVRRIVDWIARA